ncbi:MAG: hypothetical protein EOO22_12455 [Comamonadaceae bacterium]|nr:MAG: hypothetical protein EOO22_12455 [Comamonadaceae bacterium]
MEPRTYTGVSNASLHDDGLTFNITLDTVQGPVPIEASVVEIGKLVHLLSKVSIASGHIRKLPQHFVSDGTLTLRPVDASAMAVMRGAPGKTLVLMLVGATTLSYSLDLQQLKEFSSQLQTVVANLEIEG